MAAELGWVTGGDAGAHPVAAAAALVPPPRRTPSDLDIRVIDAATGELLRDLVLDPTKRYQGTGRPPGPAR